MTAKPAPASLENIIKSAEKKLLLLERQRDNISISIKEKRTEIDKLTKAAKAFKELESSLS